MTEPEIVGDKGSPPAPPSPEAATKAAPEGKPDKTEKGSRDYERELTQLRQQLTEYQQAAQHWYSKAQGILPGQSAQAQEEDDEEDEQPSRKKSPAKESEEEDDPNEFVTKLTTKGPKAVDERIERALRERGYVSRDEMDKLLERERGRFNREVQLYSKYPDLRDESSELFKATAEEFKAIVGADKRLANSPAAIEIAARIAQDRLKFSRQGSESEDDRRRRIDAQRGDVGRRGSDFDEDAEELTTIQRDMMKKFNQEGGVQITEESLKRRLKEGIRMVYDPRRDATRRSA